jgi:hypothetical protein
MYIDPLALKGLERGGLSSHPSRDAQNRQDRELRFGP